MGISKFFIDRPIFASVLSIIVTLIGGIAYVGLPIEQYPEIVPPTIQVMAQYPGANAKTIAETVATPIEQEVNGVEGMLYMSSQSTQDGQMSLTVTFELGTDLDIAQVLVQNRVNAALPRLPEEVRRLGVTTVKNSPDLMLVVNLFSPKSTYDQTYIANYGVLRIRDQLRRIDGVGNVMLFGATEYAMRVWLDPDLIQSYDLTVGEILSALRAQNIQVASGTLNQAPQPKQKHFEYSVQTKGRLVAPEEFGEIVVKASSDGRIVHLKDIARVELGAQSYSTEGYLGKQPAVALPIFQRPGSNAVTTAAEVIRTMDELKQDFPPDLEYKIVYNPTDFVEESIEKVKSTVLQAILLVTLVMLIFLQSWRAALIPVIAIPISLIGTFAVMAALGFSLNSLTLFGLMLAVGVVVDDAIVVVENMERGLQRGLSPRDAAKFTMDEVGSALIATTLVLVAVFLPTTFLEGISGRFYQQFGVTIAVATVISTIVSLTLSPALGTLVLRAPDVRLHVLPTKHWTRQPIRSFFVAFNLTLESISQRYGSFVKRSVRRVLLAFVIYGGLIIFGVFQFQRMPTGFIPPQDQGYFIVSIQLPPGASLSATDNVMREAVAKLLDVDGVANSVAFTGFSGATFSNASNAGVIFTPLESFDYRQKRGLTYDGILQEMRMRVSSIKETMIFVIPPPPVRGIGSTGGFRMMVEDREGRGLDALEKATWGLAFAASKAPETTSLFTFYENSTPQLYLDIDREKVEKLGVPLNSVFQALEVFIGSSFVNDFNFLGRTFRVTAQADAPYRLTDDDLMRIRVRNANGRMVPLGSVASAKYISGSSRVPRYNLYPSAALLGDTSPGYSTGAALKRMEEIARQVLPDGFGFEWTDIAYQQKKAGNTAGFAFLMAVIFVFLLLAAQYESWTLPLSVILIVPMCLLSAFTGLLLAGLDNNILSQIGFVVLIGLASKNAILIVEFAKELESQGKDRYQAALEAATLRLRPILMTSFSFILGVAPLVFGTGAGWEMRYAIGMTVFSGMLGVTFFGLFLTPVFYVFCSKLSALYQGEKNRA